MAKSSIPTTRDQKLAAKLKENLRRRKAQARARSDDKTDEKKSATTLNDSSNIQGS